MNNLGHFFFHSRNTQSLPNTQENNLDHKLWLLKIYVINRTKYIKYVLLLWKAGQNPNLRYLGAVWTEVYKCASRHDLALLIQL